MLCILWIYCKKDFWMIECGIRKKESRQEWIKIWGPEQLEIFSDINQDADDFYEIWKEHGSGEGASLGIHFGIHSFYFIFLMLNRYIYRVRYSREWSDWKEICEWYFTTEIDINKTWRTPKCMESNWKCRLFLWVFFSFFIILRPCCPKRAEITASIPIKRMVLPEEVTLLVLIGKTIWNFQHIFFNRQ